MPGAKRATNGAWIAATACGAGRTTGLVIGAGVGALAGSQIAADSTLGAIIGAIGGGLLGREIERGDLRCR